MLHIKLVLSDIGQVSDRWLTCLEDGVPRSVCRTICVEGLSNAFCLQQIVTSCARPTGTLAWRRYL